VKIWTESTGDPMTMTLRALIVNNGNISAANVMVARFYNANPSAGGTQIGTAQDVVPLDGCAASMTVQ
jgi:hypothetical protein